jgi:hypothetical protein
LTCLQPKDITNDPDFLLNIAPGEGKKTLGDGKHVLYTRAHQTRQSGRLLRLGFNEVAQFLSKSEVLVALSVFSSPYFFLTKTNNDLKRMQLTSLE